MKKKLIIRGNSRPSRKTRNEYPTVFVGANGNFIIIFKVQGTEIGLLVNSCFKPLRFIAEEETQYLQGLNLPLVVFPQSIILIYEDNFEDIGKEHLETSITMIVEEKVFYIINTETFSPSNEYEIEADEEEETMAINGFSYMSALLVENTLVKEY